MYAPSALLQGAALAAVLITLATGCRTPQGPRGDAYAYAQALGDGHLVEAYGLTSEAYRRQVSRPEFERTWSDPDQRAAHVSAVLDAAAGLERAAPELGPQPSNRELQEEAQRVLKGFLRAAEDRRFDLAYGLLASPLRARYTPERLAQDFALETGAPARLRRARLAAEHLPTLRGGRAEFRISDSSAVVLADEHGAFRVLALE